MHRIFLLSPARLDGKRAAQLFNRRAAVATTRRAGTPAPAGEMARQLHGGEALPLGEVFAFLSGLYFRGKLAYARRFARAPAGIDGALVITANQGLVPVQRPVCLQELHELASRPVDPRRPAYREPLERDALRTV